jgi:hypothetical protein
VSYLNRTLDKVDRLQLNKKNTRHFAKIRSAEAELLNADRHTDGTNMTNFFLFFFFCKVPKTGEFDNSKQLQCVHHVNLKKNLQMTL